MLHIFGYLKGSSSWTNVSSEISELLLFFQKNLKLCLWNEKLELQLLLSKIVLRYGKWDSVVRSGNQTFLHATSESLKDLRIL